jgi:hypothetical protein
MPWSRLVLILILVGDVWYRGHTFGPDVQEAIGLRLWPAAVGPTEPLDCDEAAYAYIGHRIARGAVMYRDLTENKPPLGYWLYTLAVAVGGYNELAIRVLPIPFILGTIALCWWIALRLGGPVPACLAAGLFAILSTDPYLFGNGANLEHFINFFGVAALALFLRGSGACLGAAALVKQVAIAPIIVFMTALAWSAWAQNDGLGRKLARAWRDVVSFGLGLVAIMGVVAAVLIVQGAGPAAYEDIFHYGRALATDTLPDPSAPTGVIRWITGNADPRGQLPWPFGTTDYLVWWGSGSWPLWLVSTPALGYLSPRPGTTRQRRLIACWSLAAWAQVALPGLYWQHYYLLPIPGVAIAVALCWADAVSVLGGTPGPRSDGPPLPAQGRRRRGLRPILMAATAMIGLTAGMAATVFLQVRDYLLVPPQELTIRYKGGRQWVVLREMGHEIARRGKLWGHPRLYIWGWQSPLHFYSRFDSPTPHFFVDNLLRDQADRDHPLIAPRTEAIIAALKRQPPELIFAGYPPFRALQAFLSERYLSSRIRGLWIRRDAFGRFETAGSPVPRGSKAGGAGRQLPVTLLDHDLVSVSQPRHDLVPALVESRFPGGVRHSGP